METIMSPLSHRPTLEARSSGWAESHSAWLWLQPLASSWLCMLGPPAPPWGPFGPIHPCLPVAPAPPGSLPWPLPPARPSMPSAASPSLSPPVVGLFCAHPWGPETAVHVKRGLGEWTKPTGGQATPRWTGQEDEAGGSGTLALLAASPRRQSL